MKSQNPLARTQKLVVQSFLDETLVYDLETHTAHCLNSTAAFVWSVCDGKNTIQDIGRMTAKKFGQPAGEDFVWLAIDSLKKVNLLKNSDEITPSFAGLSRREMIRKVGSASMIVLPLVSSLVAPEAAAAQSTTCGRTCASPGQCSAPCASCQGAGTCSIVGTPCSQIGSLCSASGTCGGLLCTDPSGNCASPGTVTGTPCGSFGSCVGALVCSSLTGSCAGGAVGSPCTAFGVCGGTGTCQ